MFIFEELGINMYSDRGFRVFHEISTDCLFVRYRDSGYNAGSGGLTQMLDPNTGKPLTYANWKEKYEKNVK